MTKALPFKEGKEDLFLPPLAETRIIDAEVLLKELLTAIPGRDVPYYIDCISPLYAVTLSDTLPNNDMDVIPLALSTAYKIEIEHKEDRIILK